MFRLVLLSVLVLGIGLDSSLKAQDSTQRTKELVASLDKTKYKKKDKGNVSIEVFVDVKNEPAIKADPAKYSGRYENTGYQLTLSVARDGKASGSGFDTLLNGDKTEPFELKDAQVAGALLTGIKVYSNGNRAPFDAVFVNQTSRRGTNPSSISDSSTKFGIGFIQTSGADSFSTNRVFLERR